MIELDEIDKRIIQLLKQNSRLSFSELARQFGFSDVAIRKRVEKLVERGVIKRFTCEINYAKLGRPVSAFVFVKTRADRTNDVLEALKAIPDVEQIYQVMGDYDIIIKTNVPDIPSLKELTDEKIAGIHGVLEVKPSIIFSQV